LLRIGRVSDSSSYPNPDPIIISMKLTRTLLVAGLFAAIPLLHAQDEKAPAKSDKAPAAEAKGDRKGGGRFGPEQQIARMKEAGIDLTAEQEAKIKAIYAKLADVPQEERRAKMQETREAVRAVLTPEQQKKFDEIRGRGPGGGRKKSE
jgi:Spy/CpxP family protein refolding chaperone